MNSGLKSLLISLAAGVVFVGVNLPANAQYMGSDSHESQVSEDAFADKSAQHIKNAEQRSIGAEGADPMLLQGVNTAGTVRVNMLANLEALLNICSNGAQLTGIIWGAILLWACIRKLNQPGFGRAFAFAMLPIILGVCTPGSINWVVATARDAGLFS
jgi:hypothetical protein